MRLPIEWIKEYTPVQASTDVIAHALTMAGLEVEETEESSLGPVLNITVTPNRGDCLSVLGVAREVAAAFNVALVEKSVAATDGPSETGRLTSVQIMDPDLCPRYAARIIRDVKPVPSPDWMRARLEASGMRPIGGIVDVTNYVMLELGQPLHAFDFNRLSEQRIVVRRTQPGERIRTLDGVDRELTADMLVICDAAKPVAIAGVMGGADTEMNYRTKTVLLESAHFHPLSVRRTSRSLGLRTEASYRFERLVDPALVVRAANRACDLIGELGMGEVVLGVIDEYPAPIVERNVTLRPNRVSLLLGYDVGEADASDSLLRLGFGVDQDKAALTVTVPTRRPDIVREEDLVEEVGRVLGYNRIPERLPHGASTQGGDSSNGRFSERIRDVLVGCGLQEVVSHSLLAPSPFEDPRTEDTRVGIRTALSAELSGLRRSLLPGLLDALERNARRGQGPLCLFEIGTVFQLEGGEPVEIMSVAGILSGPQTMRAWQREGRSATSDYYTARGIIERLADALRIDDIGFVPSTDPRLHPGRSASINRKGIEFGCVGEMHPALVLDLTVRDRVVVFELAVERLKKAAGERRSFVTLSPFPAVSRDLAPRVAQSLAYSTVREAVTGIDLLDKMELTDVYTGPPLPEGVKSLTLSLAFRVPDRTLTDSEVEETLERIRKSLAERCGAVFPS